MEGESFRISILKELLERGIVSSSQWKMFSMVFRCARTTKIGHRTSTRFNRVWVQFTYGCESSRSSNFEFTFEVNWNAVFDVECTGHADSKDDVFSWGERLLVIEHLGDVIDMLTGWKLSHNLSLFVGLAVNLVAPSLYPYKGSMVAFERRYLYFQDVH